MGPVRGRQGRGRSSVTADLPAIMGPWCGVRLTWILLLLSIPAAKGGGYQLTALRNYTVFTGDIRVSYSMGNTSYPNAMVQLLTLPGDSIISTVGIPQDYLEGELTFACSIIDYAGEFRFRLIQYYGGPTLVETPVMYVSWPLIRLTLPNQHVALSKDVTMQFTIAAKLCDTAHSTSRFWLEVVYYGNNESSNGHHGDRESPQRAVVRRQELRDFTTLQDVSLTFPCSLFDQAGIYQVTFASSGRPDRPMAISNRMRVEWSRRYSLDASVESIFPCGSFVQIYYTQPECAGHDDKIRMYKQLQIAESSAASPTNLYYVGEQRARKGSTYVTFTCNKFDENVPGYCFKYATIANNGAVHEQTTWCILSSADQDTVVHGGWGAWSSWTQCAGGLECGDGKRARNRACDNPPPAQGGRYCDGDTAQWQDCSISCKDAVTVDPPEAYTPDPACVCGCVLSVPRGKIVGTTDRCRGSSTWLVRAPRGYVIQLQFELFNLDPGNRMTWVKVRDGESHMDSLLVQQFGGQRPSTVRSSGNVLLVELMSPYDPNFYSNKETFVAIYRRIVANGTGVTGDGGRTSRTSWESTVTIVGVGLCFVIILATIAFACHYRISKRHKKTKKQQALLTPNGSMPNSPSHSHSLPSPTHGPHSPTSGSNNVTFAPDVHGEGKGRRDYVLPKGVSVVTPGAGGRLRSPTGGREVVFSVDGAAAAAAGRPGSASSHVHGGGIYVQPVQSPYGDGEYVQARVAPGADPDQHRRQRQHRRSRSPGASPPGGESGYCRPASVRSRSPDSHAGSGREPRNQSFKKAIDKTKGRDGVPLADEEDLSPTSPGSPTAPSPFYSPAKEPREQRHHRGYDRHHPAESIPMDSYHNKRFRDSGIEDTPMGLRSPDSDERPQVSPPETRPPVEGRDSGRRVHDPLHAGRYAPSPRYAHDPRYGGAMSPHRGSSATASPTPPGTPERKAAGGVLDGRPDVKPLPLRHVERPDGQSPENHHTDDRSSHTPSSMDGLSPVLQKSKLFPGTKSHTPSVLSLATQDGYEYDDYIPDLPGSYFTMDPHAYTLTWSNQQPWAQKRAAVTNSNSENSVSTQNNNESHA